MSNGDAVEQPTCDRALGGDESQLTRSSTLKRPWPVLPVFFFSFARPDSSKTDLRFLKDDFYGLNGGERIFAVEF